ncbi:MAG: cupin domain-containing protein [Gammaproteobacteria bacterium]
MDDVGRRLRALRETHKLSQRELARRANVSNAALSMIENGKTDPSLGMLKRILEGIPISVADFFNLEPDVNTQVFYRDHELVEVGSGLVSYRQVGVDLEHRRLQILHECYRPGSDTGRSLLRHEGEEGGVVIRGHIEVTVGNQARLLGPGDAYLFDSKTPHRFRNLSSEDCVLVTACTPPF